MLHFKDQSLSVADVQTAAHQLRGDGDVLHSICLPSGLLDYQIDTLWSFPVLGVLRAYRFGLRLFVFSGFTAVVPRPPPVASFSLCVLRLFVIKRISPSFHAERLFTGRAPSLLVD